MIKISEPTQQELEQGYQICPCKHGVHLLTAGFDVDTTMCQGCMREIADIDDFKTADAVRILLK
ncbi:hypothetical protein [Nitrosomonas sp.]|uniref:hypothetical protein n=1 Tax=Nitrosomonas sp. TaxID=42353 RepID=UPI0025DC5D9D|nr:hypothetical protein [Nitrosomonas sp.]MBY0484583.1 hypothetical protein [Nitrosomonas sp.]